MIANNMEPKPLISTEDDINPTMDTIEKEVKDSLECMIANNMEPKPLISTEDDINPTMDTIEKEVKDCLELIIANNMEPKPLISTEDGINPTVDLDLEVKDAEESIISDNKEPKPLISTEDVISPMEKQDLLPESLPQCDRSEKLPYFVETELNLTSFVDTKSLNTRIERETASPSGEDIEIVYQGPTTASTPSGEDIEILYQGPKTASTAAFLKAREIALKLTKSDRDSIIPIQSPESSDPIEAKDSAESIIADNMKKEPSTSTEDFIIPIQSPDPIEAEDSAESIIADNMKKEPSTSTEDGINPTEDSDDIIYRNNEPTPSTSTGCKTRYKLVPARQIAIYKHAVSIAEKRKIASSQLQNNSKMVETEPSVRNIKNFSPISSANASSQLQNNSKMVETEPSVRNFSPISSANESDDDMEILYEKIYKKDEIAPTKRKFDELYANKCNKEKRRKINQQSREYKRIVRYDSSDDSDTDDNSAHPDKAKRTTEIEIEIQRNESKSTNGALDEHVKKFLSKYSHEIELGTPFKIEEKEGDQLLSLLSGKFDDENSNSNQNVKNSDDDSDENSDDDSDENSDDDSNENSHDDSNENSRDDSNENSHDDSDENSDDDSNENSHDDSNENSHDDSDENSDDYSDEEMDVDNDSSNENDRKSEFIDNEAELSGEDSEEDEVDAEVLTKEDAEYIDDSKSYDSEELRDEVVSAHQKQVQRDEANEIKKIQELIIGKEEDGTSKRQKKYMWNCSSEMRAESAKSDSEDDDQAEPTIPHGAPIAQSSDEDERPKLNITFKLVIKSGDKSEAKPKKESSDEDEGPQINSLERATKSGDKSEAKPKKKFSLLKK